MLAFCLALPHSSWGKANLPADFSLDDVASIPQYVLEVIRKFSPVVGIPYKERTRTSSTPRRIMCNLMMAGRDRSVWGDDAEEFKLRPIKVARAQPGCSA